MKRNGGFVELARRASGTNNERNEMEKFLDGLKKPFQTAEQQKINSGDPLVSYGLLALVLCLTR